MTGVSDQALLAAILRQDLGAFVAKVFQTVSPGDLYLHNWHIDAIVYALLQVHAGYTRRLIITQPPRSLKSICASVGFVAWSLGHDPSKRFACVSYSQELAATFARQFRVVVLSDWYRALFPNVRLAKDTETECVTTKGGGRITIPVGGSFTGRGADIIIVDDPMKAGDAQSETARRTVNDWYGTTLLSRLDDKEKGAIILVMQRLHEDDLAGKLLREGIGAISICPQLPMTTKRSQSALAWSIAAREVRLSILNASRSSVSKRSSARWAHLPSRRNICNSRRRSKAILSGATGSNGTTTPPALTPALRLFIAGMSRAPRATRMIGPCALSG